MERARLVPQVEQVMALLREFQSQHANAAVFDIFNAVCPPGDQYCYPDNGSSFLYRDRDHFNSLGSRLLVEPLVEMLRSSGTLTPEQ